MLESFFDGHNYAYFPMICNDHNGMQSLETPCMSTIPVFKYFGEIHSSTRQRRVLDH